MVSPLENKLVEDDWVCLSLRNIRFKKDALARIRRCFFSDDFSRRRIAFLLGVPCSEICLCVHSNRTGSEREK